MEKKTKKSTKNSFSTTDIRKMSQSLIKYQTVFSAFLANKEWLNREGQIIVEQLDKDLEVINA
jgi:hypothetical protein